MEPAIVHKTKTLADHTTAITLCGKKLRTDHHAVTQAKHGAWVSCPLCEAAMALAGIPAIWEPDRISEGKGNPSWI